MIEPVVVTALILSILALIAYYLQPQQPHHQRHYYHQIRRARVMADPQGLRNGGSRDREAEIRGRGGGGGEGEVYERENEEGEGEDDGRGEVAIGVRELAIIGRGIVGGRLVLEEGVDAEGANESGVAVECVVEVASTHKLKVRMDANSQASIVPVIRITVPESDNTSSILSSHDVEHGVAPESCCSNTLDQQRRQRVQFDEALRMHSYGRSQYVGRMVDRGF